MTPSNYADRYKTVRRHVPEDSSLHKGKGKVFPITYHNISLPRLCLKYDGTRAETSFRLSAKRTRPFKSARASVQSTTGSRGVRISGSNAGYTMFRGSVKSTGYPLHSSVSPSLPLSCFSAYLHISTGLYFIVCHYNFLYPNLPASWRLLHTWCHSTAHANRLPHGPHSIKSTKRVSVSFLHFFLNKGDLIPLPKRGSNFTGMFFILCGKVIR